MKYSWDFFSLKNIVDCQKGSEKRVHSCGKTGFLLHQDNEPAHKTLSVKRHFLELAEAFQELLMNLLLAN